jgi:hypothetical protein
MPAVVGTGIAIVCYVIAGIIGSVLARGAIRRWLERRRTGARGT